MDWVSWEKLAFYFRILFLDTMFLIVMSWIERSWEENLNILMFLYYSIFDLLIKYRKREHLY